jgi:leucyl-tRNA synthetase
VSDGKATRKADSTSVAMGANEKISKSKCNGDDPEDLRLRFGADALRLYILFVAPPERDLEWSEAALEGARRFLNRLWGLSERAQNIASPAGFDLQNESVKTALRAIHKTIRKVTSDIENFQYNTMIAACMELSNRLAGLRENESVAEAAVLRQGVETLVQLLSPVCPHVTEELWQNLGHQTLLCQTPWPVFDEALAADEEITLAVQVNGKLRGTFVAPAGINETDAKTQALQAVAEHVKGLTIQRSIYVPGRIVNIVAQ